MANAPKFWEHKSGYHLNADGKSIEYEHTKKNLLAVVEGIVDEENDVLEYYTVLFDTSGGKPWDTVVPHEFHAEKDDAQDYLQQLMENHT